MPVKASSRPAGGRAHSSATRTIPHDATPPLVYAVLADVKRARGVTEADHVALVRLLLDAGATRAESFNRWHEAPESLARPSVVHALREREFAP